MRKQRKNGFTLVELSIVIAVIAILIAVLVPTFTALIDKANKTNDNSLVKNLNTGLSTDEAINGKPSTIDEALVAAEGAGYKVENLTPTSDGTLIVWNEVDNEFVYVEADLVNGNLVEVDGEALTTDSCNIWIITKSYDSTYADFSQYISGTLAENTTLEVKAGISVGNNTNIDISYANSNGEDKEVTFVTNGGTLTLDDANATVYHYGTADTVTVTAVDKLASYHLYGTVTGNINLAYGHVVLENTASAVSILVTASTAENVSVTNESSSKVELAATTKNVAAAVAGDDSSITTVTTVISSDTLTKYAGGLGTESSPYLIANETQFANIASGSSSTKKYYKLTNDITLTAATQKYYTYSTTSITGYCHVTSSMVSCFILDGDYNNISLADDVEGSNSLFFRLGTYVTIKNVTVNFTKSGQQIVRYLNGSNASTKATTYFENVTTTGDVSVTGNYGCFVSYAQGYIEFINCTNKTNLNGIGTWADYNAAFIGYVYNTLRPTFTDCTNEGNIICGKAALFVGNIPSSSAKLYLTVNNCSNNGVIRSTFEKDDEHGSYTPYYYIAMQANYVTLLTVDGTEYDYNAAPSIENTFQGPVDIMTITLNKDGYYEVTKSNQSNVAKYQLSVGLYVNTRNSSGKYSGTSRYYITVTVDASELESGTYVSVLQNLKFMDLDTYLDSISTTENKVEEFTYSGDTATVKQIGNGYMVCVDSVWYYLINSTSCYLDEGKAEISMVTSAVYDSTGKLLSSVAG